MKYDLQRSDKGLTGIFKLLTMTRTDRINNINRGVIEYQPSCVDAFFDPDNGVYNAIISGGDQQLRINAIVAQTACAIKNSFPVIIIHEGNKLLEQQLRYNFQSIGKYKEISCNNPCFEPFYGLNELEISNQILETAPKEFDIKYNARYYIDGISKFLQLSGRKHSFSLFSTCPHALLFDKVDDYEAQGKISAFEAQEIKSKLMMGQSENYKLDTFLANMRMEIEPLMYVSKKGYRPMNVIRALKENSILCFDLMSVTNKILLNTVIYQLKIALTKGITYQIIIDNISINSDDSFASYLCTPSDKICKTISTDDFYTMTGGDEKVFSAVVGNSQIMVIMRHVSGHSATKWAEVLGQYDKFEESYSTSRGESRKNPFSIMSSPNYNKTTNINKTREYVVKPESITHMETGEAYVLSTARGELAHLFLT